MQHTVETNKVLLIFSEIIIFFMPYRTSENRGRSNSKVYEFNMVNYLKGMYNRSETKPVSTINQEMRVINSRARRKRYR